MTEKTISSTPVQEASKKNAIFNDAISELKELAKKIDPSSSANGPIEEIRTQYQQAFDILYILFGQGKEKDVKLLARIQSIGATLQREANLSGQEERLVSEINRLIEILETRHAEINRGKAAADVEVKRTETKSPKEDSKGQTTQDGGLVANVLGSFSSLGQKAIDALKGIDLLDEKKFLKVNAAKLADVLRISPDEALQVKDKVNEDIKKRQEAEIAVKLQELEKSNGLLLRESEKLISENNGVIGTNKELQEKYALLFSRHQEVETEYKALKNTIATAQVEFNRLSLEISFLKDERARLVDFIDGKNDVLGKLLSRFEAVRTSYEFAKGEEVASKDLLVHLESLLDVAFKQKKSLENKVESTTNAFEKLHSEINDIIKQGKLYYYDKLHV